MAVSEPVAYAIFASYFGLIFTSLGFVLRSLLKDVPPLKLLEAKPFLFLRIAVGALACTWWFMFSYMKWSLDNYSVSHPGATVGAWLGNTALFEEAWTIVCSTPERWAISSFICTWTVLFTYIVYSESGRRGIKHPWAYMLLGQLVAVSFSTALFYAACSLRPRRHVLDRKRLQLLLIPLGLAMFTILYTPRVVGTDRFMPNLLGMHLALVAPLVIPPKAVANSGAASGEKQTYLFGLLLLGAAAVHLSNFPLFPENLPSYTEGIKRLYGIVLSHPAQSSISFDVVWSAITAACWFFSTGSLAAIVLKFAILVATISGLWIRQTGINWTLVLSIVPIVGLVVYGVITMALGQVRGKNDAKRKAALQSLGITEESVIPGTDKVPPSFAPRRTVVGFWHPFCNAGGGGERVLWTGIAHLQRAHPDVVSLVYTGDYPQASKEEILRKINERFSIVLSPHTLHFIPLRSRHLVDDGYWQRFTLLGQSLGSIRLVWEGLAGPDGFWGDIFVDTMGYAFTFPFVRLITGDEITIGTYTHYPTVSADMVARVKARSYGVENAGASTSWLRTQVKLIYYRIFTSLYAFSLLFSEYSMSNSSWTQAHFTSLLAKGRNGVLAFLFLMDETALQKNGGEKAACDVVFPPCDTGALSGSKLDGRSREIVSLAQFRPEKEHWKQIEALAILFERHPGQRAAGVKLVLMGGARHPADEQRVTELRELARMKGVKDAVEFVVNAPYGTVVDRLGKASLGLNTMQDEHFGINVVEFMAAGLIPVVHASAGPLMDIVVPHNGQRTGFHAKTADEFAETLHEALSLSADQSMRMRRAARALAVEKFSEARFDQGWEKGWKVLEAKSAARRPRRQA